MSGNYLFSVAKEGANEEETLVLTHLSCNQAKRDKTLFEFFKFRSDSGKPKSTFYSPKITRA